MDTKPTTIYCCEWPWWWKGDHHHFLKSFRPFLTPSCHHFFAQEKIPLTVKGEKVWRLFVEKIDYEASFKDLFSDSSIPPANGDLFWERKSTNRWERRVFVEEEDLLMKRSESERPALQRRRGGGGERKMMTKMMMPAISPPPKGRRKERD